MSVMIVEKGADKERALKDHDGFGLVEFEVKLVRGLKQSVVFDPLPQEPAHGLVVGEKRKGAFCRRVAKAARWVVLPRRGGAR